MNPEGDRAGDYFKVSSGYKKLDGFSHEAYLRVTLRKEDIAEVYCASFRKGVFSLKVFCRTAEYVS